MDEEIEGAKFIADKYSQFAWSDEVKLATKKHNVETGENVNLKNKKDKTKRVEAYLQRYQEALINEPDEEKKQKRLEKFESRLLNEVVIDPEDFPEDQIQFGLTLLRREGFGNVEPTPEIIDNIIEGARADQKATFKRWTQYFINDGENYPAWFKYYTLKNISELQPFDEEQDKFPKRSKETTKGFPQRDEAALANVYNALVRGSEIETDDKELTDAIEKGDFSKLYRYYYKEERRISGEAKEEREGLDLTDGKWVIYKQYSDDEKDRSEEDLKSLVDSVQNTPWCTKAEPTARGQLEGGDFHVFYSRDKDGNLTIPTIGVRMERGVVREVHGTEENQELNPQLTEITSERLESLPGGDVYEKKVNDMKRLTDLESKIKDGGNLTKDELIFLYQVDDKIEGFGYEDDPRTWELLRGRNEKEDVALIFNVDNDRVATTIVELEPDSIVLMGHLIVSEQNHIPDSLKFVLGDIDLNSYAKYYNLRRRTRKDPEPRDDDPILTLKNIQFVGGNLDISGSAVESLGSLKTVHGDVNISDSKISAEDLKNIEIGGQVEV